MVANSFHACSGKFIGGIEIPKATSLEEVEGILQGEDKKRFLEFMRKMLQWDPEKRSSAAELLQDPWLQEELESPI